MNPSRQSSGVALAIAAATLFGVTTPLSKLLLGGIKPLLLAALLYLGSGIGLTLWAGLRSLRGVRSSAESGVTRRDLPWLAAAILMGGVVAPVLLMLGLSRTPASSASLMLNLEGVFTALLAWTLFRENFDRRIALGMMAIILGCLLLSWSGPVNAGSWWGALAIVAACFAWGLDNNLTRKVSASDPIQIAAAKGLAAGGVNLLIALGAGAALPQFRLLGAASMVGFLGYGASLTFYILALRNLGTARTGAYFSLAPFVGALISVTFLGEPISASFLGAAVLMGAGIWLHVTERHVHVHVHERTEHAHRHWHDAHHQHGHEGDISPSEPHSHEHIHETLEHAHVHYPDIHHRHEHEP